MVSPIFLVSNDETLARIAGEYLQRELGAEYVHFTQATEKYPEDAIVLWDGPGAPPGSIPLNRPVNLAALARQILHRQAGRMRPVWGEILFDPSTRRLLEGDKTLMTLTGKESALLGGLLEAGTEGVSREALLASAWPDAGAQPHTLQAHLHRLRAKLKQAAGEDILAATPAGYRLKNTMENDG